MRDKASEYSYLQQKMRGVEEEMTRDSKTCIQRPLLGWGEETDIEVSRLLYVLNMVPRDKVPADWSWMNEVMAHAGVMARLWDFQASIGDPDRKWSKGDKQLKDAEPE
jgi:hypothetical protein